MKRILIFLSLFLSVFSCQAQQGNKYTEDDVKQFYRTIQGDYQAQLNDSVSLSLHFTPIWEQESQRFRWLYMEAIDNESKKVIEQQILEIVPVSDITFKIIAHGLRKPETFVGKWSNRNFFDGFNTSILKGGRKFLFMKTQDFDYQTNWCNRKSLKCFAAGDRIHFKFSQEQERFYVKRIPSQSTKIFGYTFIKALTD